MSNQVTTKGEWEKRLGCISIKEEVMNKLVMNYLVTEGYPETAKKFKAESGTQLEMDLVSITDRMLIKKALMEGNVEEAIDKINHLNPEILDTDPLLFYHLQLQRLIELIRQGNTDKALDFCGKVLNPIVEDDQNFLGEYEQTAVLFCIGDMDICPVKHLMDQAQRSKRADEVNAAILKSQNREQDSKLRTLLKMLIWAESEVKGITFRPHILDLSEAAV
ncbi:hypothetical protein QQ045_009077 [Rhodiola kirilowii]